MSIFRTHHDKSNPYVILNKSFLEDAKLSAKAKGILAYLLSRPDNWETRTEQLIAVMRDGRDSILSGLTELEKAGYFERSPVRDPKTKRISHWIKNVYECPTVKQTSTPLGTLDDSGKTINGKAVNGIPGNGAINGFSGEGFSGEGNPAEGYPDDGDPYCGNPGQIINKDAVTIESTSNDLTSTECNKDTHTNAIASVVEILQPETEQLKGDRIESIQGHQDLMSLGHPKDIEETLSSDYRNYPDHEDKSSAGGCDNNSKRPKFLVSKKRVDELEALYDSGDSLGVYTQEELQALADRVMGEQVYLYRLKTRKILGGNVNDIDWNFVNFYAWRHWHSETEKAKALDTILSMERDISKWQKLYATVAEWQESMNNPEKFKAEALRRAGSKLGSSSEVDQQIATQQLEVTLERVRKERAIKEAAVKAREEAEAAKRVNTPEATSTQSQCSASPQSGDKPFEQGKGDPIPAEVKAEVDAIAARVKQQEEARSRRYLA